MSTNTNLKSNWAFRIWAICVLILAIAITAITSAWSVRHAYLGGKKLSPAQSRFAMNLAEFPGIAKSVIVDAISHFSSRPTLLLFDRKKNELPSWKRHFPEQSDPGYLLLSGISPEDRQSVVKLIRIADGKTLVTWKPDWNYITAHTTSKRLSPAPQVNEQRAVHPLLLDDGDIIFNVWVALVRQTPCRETPLWINDNLAHHSVEFDEDRSGIWTPSVDENSFSDNTWIRERIRNDALAHFTLDGKLDKRLSFSAILIANGLEALLLGTSGNFFNYDPTHLNEVKVAQTNTDYWKKGDMLISARHLSTIFLYRPSSNRIVWHKTGPWMNQHSADFVGNHQISVLDNNIIAGAPKDYAFAKPPKNNHVFLYNFETNQASEPFAKLLTESQPRTITEGRAQILPDGGLFIEETMSGRLLRFTKNRILWSYINDYDKDSIGFLGWSRYLTADEVAKPLRSIQARHCLRE